MYPPSPPGRLVFELVRELLECFELKATVAVLNQEAGLVSAPYHRCPPPHLFPPKRTLTHTYDTLIMPL